jgi:hypothetical protein
MSRVIMGLLPLLHGQFNCGWSKMIVIFTIQPRHYLLWKLHRYMYRQTSLELPLLRCDNFLCPIDLIYLTEARPLIRTELNVKSHDGGQVFFGLVDCAATLTSCHKTS